MLRTTLEAAVMAAFMAVMIVGLVCLDACIGG